MTDCAQQGGCIFRRFAVHVDGISRTAFSICKELSMTFPVSLKNEPREENDGRSLRPTGKPFALAFEL